MDYSTFDVYLDGFTWGEIPMATKQAAQNMVDDIIAQAEREQRDEYGPSMAESIGYTYRDGKFLSPAGCVMPDYDVGDALYNSGVWQKDICLNLDMLHGWEDAAGYDAEMAVADPYYLSAAEWEQIARDDEWDQRWNGWRT